MALTDIGSGVLYEGSTTGSGTGNYNSFVRINATNTETGFNTDVNNQDDNKNGPWTHSLQVSSLDTVTIGTTDYYVIRLDLNEIQSGDSPNITLEDLQLFRSAAPAVDDSFAGMTQVFDLGSALSLVDTNHGSGTDDYVFYIPTSLFPDPNQYFTLYAEFSGSDDGFEEFRALTSATGDGLPTIHLEKTADPTHFDEGTHDVTYTYVVTNTSAVTDPLTLSSFTDDNGTPGDPSDDVNLLAGVDATHPLGIYYVSGDTNGDQKLQTTETWTFQYTAQDVPLNAGDTRVNVATVTGVDDEGNNTSDDDDATVTGDDVKPAITLVKDADPTSINEGTPTDILYTYTLTSQSPASDPLTINSLIDDNGTPGVLNSGDDFDLIAGVDALHPLGIYYVSGDANDNQLLDSTETWVFQYTKEDVDRNAKDGDLVNTAVVTAHDDENNEATSTDDATVTVNDVDPTINIDKVASVTQIQAGLPTDVTFTYSITNTSPAGTDDPITVTHLVDDAGTPGDTSDDFILFDGDSTLGLGSNYVSGDDGDGLLEKGETWVFQYTVNDMVLDAGETRTNIATVTGHDDEDNSVSDTDDAAITAFNLGRTPGFWSNNGSKLWDGNTNTFPKAGGLGIVAAGHDLLSDNLVHDTNGDGTVDNVAGSAGYLMIGDWDGDGVADPDENVLVISRPDALSLLNSSLKQQQDGRFQLARDVVASWLNYLGGSYVGVSDNPNSAMHYIDEATAWLIQTTADHNHVLTVSELTTATKVLQSSSAWGQGFDFDGDSIKGENQTPTPPSHDIGLGTTLDIMAGSVIHTGLDHYNNFGFV